MDNSRDGSSPAPAPDNLPNSAVPEGGGAVVQAPAWLSDTGRGYWADLLRHLPAGAVTPADSHALGMLANELATYADADSLVQEAGILITANNGDLVPNPALPIRDRASAAVARWSAFLRISPDTRQATKHPSGNAIRHRKETAKTSGGR